MKYLALFFCLFINYSFAQISVSSKTDINTPIDDTTSNYALFDYINLLTAENYYILLDSIKNQLSNDFFTLRMAYTKTSDYNPYDNELVDLHQEIFSFLELNKYEEALGVAESILAYNYVDIKTHKLCVYIYEQLEDSLKSNYHFICYNGLLKSIYKTGDGSNEKTAYIVITTKEEYSFLNMLDSKPTKQSLIHKDGYSFDILEAIDNKSKEGYKIYFNVQLPISELERSLNPK